MTRRLKANYALNDGSFCILLIWCKKLISKELDVIIIIVQLLLLYVQWEPRNYEKCKMVRLIHIIMMSVNKFRFVAQVATFGNFFY